MYDDDGDDDDDDGDGTLPYKHIFQKVTTSITNFARSFVLLSIKRVYANVVIMLRRKGGRLLEDGGFSIFTMSTGSGNCLVPTSTTRFASDLGIQNGKK